MLCCVLTNGDGNDHGVRRANTAQAHARWHYLVASHEATNKAYLPGGMVIGIAVESVTLYFIVNNRLS